MKEERKALRGRRPMRAPPSAASSEAIKPSRLGGHAALVGREPCSYPASYSRLNNDPAKSSGVCKTSTASQHAVFCLGSKRTTAAQC